ncbi:XRE family transcriptional regulator [Gluconobacter albidus]|uniref:XRE family transcriptional regulator n=1 Tax=Gluconobacter albidus TaxID=318683 RepID=A0A149TMX3_9PROT|nr:response regulator transcription factor [Gluconobacter albidus]KXV50420.1 XRE family transcriptional regulator [Gluconobacter albidus]
MMNEPLSHPKNNILLIEDDLDTADYIEKALSGPHTTISIITDGKQGKDIAISGHWDCIILDRRLPRLDGLSILKDLRAIGLQTPVLFLTTMDGIHERVTGLRSGADDYLVKPFSVHELSARLENLLRRTQQSYDQTRLVFADLKIDLLTREVRRGGEKLYIQAQELKLLEYFMRHPHVTLSREMLLQAVWDIDFPVHTNLVDTHVSRLRERLGRDAPPLIQTLKGQGYMLKRT